MFKFIRYIRTLIYLSRQANTFLGDAEDLLEEDEEKAEELRGYYRRIVVLGITFPVIYGLLVPIAVPWAAFFVWERENPGGAFVATAVGLLFSLAAALFYIFAGVSLGCLFAPEAFFDSPVGLKWLELIGTKNHTAARVVCMTTALTGLLIAGGLALTQLWLMNGPAFNK